MEEKREIIKETNLTALYLLEFYLSMITRKSYIITDTKTATATGLSLRSVQDTRRLLFRHNLFHEIKTTDGNTIIYLYCVRKEGVYSMKYFDRLFGCKSASEVLRKHKRKDIDAISIGTPNHWHSLAAVWGCQAGKDVLVEKPVSHNIWEGRKVVEAARRYDRMVQADFDSRSSPEHVEIARMVQSEELGKLLPGGMDDVKVHVMKIRADLGIKHTGALNKNDFPKFVQAMEALIEKYSNNEEETTSKEE